MTPQEESTIQKMEETSPETAKSGTARRGFGSMAPERQRQIASMGGKAVPAKKRTYSYDKETAREAGRKGGRNVPPEKRMFFRDRELAARIGALGGSAKRTPKGGLAKRRQVV